LTDSEADSGSTTFVCNLGVIIMAGETIRGIENAEHSVH